MLHGLTRLFGTGRLTAQKAAMSGNGECRSGSARVLYARPLKPLVILLARQAARQEIATRCKGEGR
jgi:hypothetical protein